MGISRANKAFLWSVFILLACLLLTLSYGSHWKSLERGFTSRVCSASINILVKEYLCYYNNLGNTIAEIEPPETEYNLQLWAKEICCALDQNANLFLLKGGDVIWVAKFLDQRIDEKVIPIPQAIDSNSFKRTPNCGDRFAGVTHQSFQRGIDEFVVWIADKRDGSPPWGVILSTDSILSTFFKPLAASRKDAPLFGSPAWVVQSVFAVPSSIDRHYKTHVRVTHKNKVLLESPQYDMTLPVQTDSLFGVVIKTYLSQEDQMYADLVGHRIMRKILPIAIIGMIFILAVLFRYASQTKL